MSGKRTKALRAEFVRRTGQAPKTHEVRLKPKKGVRAWFRALITESRNEFRRFKRSGKTELEIAQERRDREVRRAQYLEWVERNNERIADGRQKVAA